MRNETIAVHGGYETDPTTKAVARDVSRSRREALRRARAEACRVLVITGMIGRRLTDSIVCGSTSVYGSGVGSIQSSGAV